MPYDYTNLLQSENNLIDSWKLIWNEDLTEVENLLALLPRIVLLPYDHYRIIAAYLFTPSALSNIVPYLFLFGQSGSGKTTLSKFASKWYGVKTNSPTDTYAGIRNDLEKRKYQEIEVQTSNPDFPNLLKKVETNTAMVYEDIDPSVFMTKPDLYRLFKVGYDRSTDTIAMSSENKGENMEFRCFCPKIFSSISPFHLNDNFKELRRRVMPIPFKKIEDLPDGRLAELGTSRQTWQKHLINIDAYDWNGFDNVFSSYWDTELASVFLLTRKTLAKTLTELTSNQKAIILDVLTAGIVSGVWSDEIQAISELKAYFNWYSDETSKYSGLSKYLRDYISASSNTQLPQRELRRQISIWFEQGWILENPSATQLRGLLADLGYVLYQGNWIKR